MRLSLKGDNMKLIQKGALASAMLSGMLFAGNHTGLDIQTRSAHFLSDSQGMALYTFDKDELDQSHCQGKCLEKWPPLQTSARKQIAYKHHPLYYFFKDSKPGQTQGDHVKSVWHLVYPAKGFTSDKTVTLSEQTNKQHYLTDEKGMALYTFDKDSQGKSHCQKGCIQKWPVFYTDLSTLPKSLNKENFGTIKRSDGAMQTTYHGMPLYYFFKDTAPKQTNGDWVKGVWHLAEPGV
jgi:predicted lipoprotein with Yx(FWY)xxD motif